MRYPEGSPTELPMYAEAGSMNAMLLFTVSIALLVGVVLLVIAVRGRVIWLLTWSVMLIAFSLAYVSADLAGFF